LDNSRKFKYSKIALAGAGTQTAGLAFGGYTPTANQMLQKNIMVLLGQSGSLKYSKTALEE
jgi:hypothetical protein